MPLLLLAEAGKSFNSDLISLFKHNDDTPKVLERLVQETHTDKELCSLLFLNHPGSEDMLWGLMKLLRSKDPRVAGNAAYLIGTLAEIDVGKNRVVHMCTEKKALMVLPTLTAMLSFDDMETVMNAAGTLGTLADDEECRMWMLREEYLTETISKLTSLLLCKDLCTASNAALVLARLTIAEEGCARILNNKNSNHILINLCKALGLDETGRGMNAAFAIGRLCDLQAGCAKMMSLQQSNRMLTTLIGMLCSNDVGCCKNACFALSCIASAPQGHERLLAHPGIDDVVKVLCSMLTSEDEESVWFAAMMLHTLASHKKGVLFLREQSAVNSSLKALNEKPDLRDDIREEVQETIEFLKKLGKPKAPSLRVESSYTIIASWEMIQPKSGLDVTYELQMDEQLVYTGPKNSFTAGGLKPVSTHSFCLRALTEGDESPYSKVVSASTPESVPSAPQKLEVMAKTTNQIKIGWDKPEETNGVLRGYQVVTNGKTSFLDAHENYFIASGLPGDTEFMFQVYALTSKGRGDAAFLTTKTDDLGSFSPIDITIQALGRHELFITWEPPAKALGRINNYEVKVNDQMVYTGVDRSTTVKFLKPNTEYIVTVSAWTSEGRCESDPFTKRTPRELYSKRKVAGGSNRSLNTSRSGEARQSRVSTKTRKKASSKRTVTSDLPGIPSRKPLYPYDKIRRQKLEREKASVTNRAKTADLSTSSKTRIKKSSNPEARVPRPHTTVGDSNNRDGQQEDTIARKISAGQRGSKSKRNSPALKSPSDCKGSYESLEIKELTLDVPDASKDKRKTPKRSTQVTNSSTTDSQENARKISRDRAESTPLNRNFNNSLTPLPTSTVVLQLPAEGKQAGGGRKTTFAASFDELKQVHRIPHAQFTPSTNSQEISRTGAESSH